MGREKVITKDRESDGGENKKERKTERINLNCNCVGTAGRDGLAVSVDQVWARCWGCSEVRDDAAGSSSIDEESLATDVICEVEEGATGGSNVYNPLVVACFSAAGRQ